MKTVLLALNAKFIHPGVASYHLAAYVKTQGIDDIAVLNLAINHPLAFIMSEIQRLQPDILGVSCYIWNIELAQKVMATVRLALPHVVILTGGPEIDGLLDGADYALIGEGEINLVKLLKALAAGETNLPRVWRNDASFDLNDAPFLYEAYPLSTFEHQLIYYETSRSCPFSCTYCYYGNDRGLRFLQMERLKRELRFLIDARVKQVKFLDRSFNARRSHALEIWQFLIDHDNGYTNFHFEVYADLLSVQMLALLATVRPGLFQFEVGIQSTNLETLQLVRRRTNLPLALANIKKIPKSIHMHLDLIAGLPGEGYASFKQSFNDVYALDPDRLQLGFLKLLKNTSLYDEAAGYGIVCQAFAPYTVVYTNWMGAHELMALRSVERVLNLFFNKARHFEPVLKACLAHFETPFDLYEDLAHYYEGKCYHWVSHKTITLAHILEDYHAQLLTKEH